MAARAAHARKCLAVAEAATGWQVRHRANALWYARTVIAAQTDWCPYGPVIRNIMCSTGRKGRVPSGGLNVRDDVSFHELIRQEQRGDYGRTSQAKRRRIAAMYAAQALLYPDVDIDAIPGL